MTGTITLWDGGQNYIEFDVEDSLITEVRPALLAGWKDCRITNMSFVVGGTLKVLLWNNYELPLKYKISKIKYGEIVLPPITIAEGSATSTVAFGLIDGLVDFVKTGVITGDIVSNETTEALSNVRIVKSKTELGIEDNIMRVDDKYKILRIE